jgi:hypothetical protein
VRAPIKPHERVQRARWLSGAGLRAIHHRIVATYRGEEFYDGDRNYGYGGLRYDGRWAPIARSMHGEYGLSNAAAVLQLGCEKGFLLHDFHDQFPDLILQGVETSGYAIEQAMSSVRALIRHGTYTALPFGDHVFDLVIAIGVVYTLSLTGAIACLKEIQRVGKGKSFITLGAYRTDDERRLLGMWSLLGTTILHEEEWLEVLEHVGYTGDYAFVTARSLKLVEVDQTTAP